MRVSVKHAVGIRLLENPLIKNLFAAAYSPYSFDIIHFIGNFCAEIQRLLTMEIASTGYMQQITYNIFLNPTCMFSV